MAVDLGAELQRLARAVQAVGTRVQHRAAVAQAVTPWRLSRWASMRATCGVVSARTPERAAAELVDQLEGLAGRARGPVPDSSDSRCSSSGGITSSKP